MAEGGGARTELGSWSPHRVTPSPELVQGCRPTCVLGSWTQPTYLQLPWKVLCEPGAVLPSESPSVLRRWPFCSWHGPGLPGGKTLQVWSGLEREGRTKREAGSPKLARAKGGSQTGLPSWWGPRAGRGKLQPCGQSPHILPTNLDPHQPKLKPRPGGSVAARSRVPMPTLCGQL